MLMLMSTTKTDLMIVVVLLLILKYSIGFKALTETDFNNCFTWRDDLEAVTLTCRVPNFSTPVTFFHNESGTEVTCYIQKNNSHCTPRNKTVTIEHSNQTVTIVLVEEKTHRHLNGTWYCKQGVSILTTEVSFSDGIIVDSWIKIQGREVKSSSENETHFIDVVCSSCRKPQGLITEFFMNGITISSVYQDDLGNCIHKSLSCSANLCNCTSTGNMFSLRLQIPSPNNGTEFACEMLFSDGFRKGRFSKTAFMKYTASGFKTKEPIAKILRKNEDVLNGNKYLVTTVKSLDIKEQNSESAATENDNHLQNILLPTLSTICCIAVLCSIVFGMYICTRKRKYGKYDKLKKKTKTSMLPTQCTSCSKHFKAKRLGYMCFDCQQFTCKKCSEFFHKRNEDVKQHKIVEMNMVPEQFSVQQYNCRIDKHTDSKIEYFCQNHKELCCMKCKVSAHSKCVTERILDILPEQLNRIICDHESQLDATEEMLISVMNSVKRVIDSYYRSCKSSKNLIENSNKTEFVLKEDDATVSTMSLDEIMNELDKREKDNNANYHTTRIRFDSMLEKIQQQKSLLKFVSKYGGYHHLVMSALTFDKTLLDMDTSTIEPTAFNSRLKLYENGKIEIGKELISWPPSEKVLNNHVEHKTEVSKEKEKYSSGARKLSKRKSTEYFGESGCQDTNTNRSDELEQPNNQAIDKKRKIADRRRKKNISL